MLSQETSAFILILFVDIVLTQCPVGCKLCSGSTCTSCESSFFLSNNLCLPCPENCDSCNSLDDCTLCKPSKFGLQAKCNFTCERNCLNSECQDDTGFCTQCKPGFYGQQCTNNCSVCANERCDLRTCSNGCTNGYYEFTNGVETVCQKCSFNCKQCKDGKTCSICNNGFHLYKLNDSVHCVSCLQESQCSNYCVIRGCNQCQIHDYSLVCADCPEGQTFNGETCGSHTSLCSKECSTKCDSTGICQGECNEGWTGEKCSEQCNSKCLKCSKDNGNSCLLYKETSVSATTTLAETVTQQQKCVRCEDEVNNFTIGFFSGIGSCVAIEVFAVLFYLIRRRYLASKTPQEYKPNDVTRNDSEL
ncbi:proprotein convertase subtilisin/kexin type 5-like [Ruditapes philippinarum]|uniref:proprotein convertase subtilisin/kexin type 5-like n=1 Tax=Ruditapes philippinarum TaxID=129788 RepID=UPI00295AEA32|nr:proprotein convertase subtilisin/kexin type 5-like [Ruditapes philippinarum]